MSFLDKLLFWRKEPEAMPDFGRVPDQDLPPSFAAPTMPGLPKLPNEPDFNEPEPTPMAEPYSQGRSMGAMPGPGMSRAPRPEAFGPQPEGDALINAKLDTIKAQLDSIIQRLDRLEKGGDERAYQRRWR